MRHKFFSCILLVCLSFLGCVVANAASKQKINRVIYITLDGVRWQDVYLTEDYFHKMHHKHGNKLNFYGKPGSKQTIEVASIPISLPSYQSQMAGSVQPCDGNSCGQIAVQTLPEYLKQQLRLKAKDVVMFASWVQMRYSVEANVGSIFTNYGNMPGVDPDTQKPDEVMALINAREAVEHPPHGDRYDNFTILHAFHYLKKYRPTFMWISLAASDNAAHANDLYLYHGVLHYYDEILDTLFELLKEQGMDKDTMVVVSTDHGRADSDWTTHGPSFPESKRTWAFVYNGELVPDSIDGDGEHYSTLSIRPTIEKALLG